MFTGSRRLFLRLSFIVALVVLALSFQPRLAVAECTFEVDPYSNCSQSCYQRVYCEAIQCFQLSWATGGDGSECCHYNYSARFCGSDCPLFCAEP
jgi:hypothetical protein